MVPAGGTSSVSRDFAIGRRLCRENFDSLLAVGHSANQRLCDAQVAPDVATFQDVTRPFPNEDGLYAPGLRFGDTRVMAVMAATVGFCHLFEGASPTASLSSARPRSSMPPILLVRPHTISVA